MEELSLFNDIYLFVIDSDAEGYAHYGAVYKRKTATSTKLAAEEIMNGSPETDWTDVKKQHAGIGLDMTFSTADKSLVFVIIRAAQSIGQSADILHHDSTYFGKDVVVDLPIAPWTPSARIIKNADVYSRGTAEPRLCSFELDVGTIRSELSSANPRVLTRFPIVFDFVDSADGVSPVFKKPKSGAAAGVGDQLQNTFDHGGIHPRGGSSLIIIEDE